MPPFTSVATQTLPSASIAIESSSCSPGSPEQELPPFGRERIRAHVAGAGDLPPQDPAGVVSAT